MAVRDDLGSLRAADQLAGAQVRISAGFGSSPGSTEQLTIAGTTSGVLDFGSQDITYSYNSMTGVLTLSGVSTFDNYEAALAQALREGRIAGAGVDVLTTEPPRDGNPLLEVAGPNCIVTPHVAWASQQAMARLAEEVMRNIEAFYRGEARNRGA